MVKKLAVSVHHRQASKAIALVLVMLASPLVVLVDLHPMNHRASQQAVVDLVPKPDLLSVDSVVPGSNPHLHHMNQVHLAAVLLLEVLVVLMLSVD